MDWFFSNLTEKCAQPALGEFVIGTSKLCTLAGSDTFFYFISAIFVGFVALGTKFLYQWRKWQLNVKKEKQND
jgi:hypothetical protein